MHFQNNFYGTWPLLLSNRYQVPLSKVHDFQVLLQCQLQYGILNFARGNINLLDVVIFSNTVTEETF